METAFTFLNAHPEAFNAVKAIGLAVLVVVLWKKAIRPLAEGFWREYGRK